MEQCLFHVEAEMINDDKVSLVKGLRQRMNPLDYLAQLEQRLPSTVQVLASVDYISLNRECNKLLKLMRLMINRNCNNPFPMAPKLPTDYSYEAIHPEMIVSALSERLQKENFGGLLNVEADMWVWGREDSKLETAREVLVKYLQTKQKKQ